jgi:outer membrane lipopolysaccharide assembly protein LptE/RlpB|tara:strand:- start:440 stop:841 length:402 start_codon:yes stop_codon:yes gene_type:complete
MNVDGLENIIIISNGHTSISNMLSQKLGSSVILQIQDYNTYPVVKINSISSRKRQLSVNSSGRVDEYEISKSLDYEIISSENNSVTGTLKASGSYDFNESRMQITSEQEKITNNAIDKVLVRKLIQKLRYNLK